MACSGHGSHGDVACSGHGSHGNAACECTSIGMKCLTHIAQFVCRGFLNVVYLLQPSPPPKMEGYCRGVRTLMDSLGLQGRRPMHPS